MAKFVRTICEGLTLETSAFKLFYGGQFTLSTQVIILNYPKMGSGSLKMSSEKITDICYKMDTRFKEVEHISQQRKQRLTDNITLVIVLLPQ